MKGWERKPIGEICEVIAGQSPEGKFYNDEGKGFPFYQGKKDFGEKYIQVPRVWTTFATKIACAGDILMSVRAPVGPINFTNEKICIGRGLAAIRVSSQIDCEFLFYFLLAYQPQIKGNEGAVFASINKNQIESISIPLPPLPEQRRIVALLDEAFAGLETLRANAEKNVQNARELFDSYLNTTFTQGLLLWEEKNFGEICENLDSRRKPVTKKDRAEGSIPYYGASGIVDYVDQHIFDEEILLVSEDGANLLARTYPIAFSVSGKCWVNNHAHVVRFTTRTTQRFVEYYLNNISLEPYVSGMAQPKLNQKALNSIKIPFPPVDEQEKIVAKADSLIERVERLEKIYEDKLAAIDELKQSILHRAFSGQLTTSKTAAA